MSFNTKGMRFPARPLSKEDIVSLVSSFGDGFCGIRNAAIIMLIWRSGLRVSEALELNTSDINTDKGEITVRHGKGDKMRLVGFDESIEPFLNDWFESRVARFGENTPKLLFCTFKGGPIDPSYIRHMLKRNKKKANIDGRVHAHGLRHSHAFEMLQEGVSIVHIKDQLGHSNIATTDHYLRHLDPSERIGRIRSRSI